MRAAARARSGSNYRNCWSSVLATMLDTPLAIRSENSETHLAA